MATVSKILETKGNAIFYVEPTQTVYEALEQLVGKNVSALLVMENGSLKGIFSEKDYARKVILKGKSSRETKISDIMTTNLITITPNTSINECMELMTRNFIRHLPVLDGDEVLGVISIGDVVKHVISDQQFIIENMQTYITSNV